MRSFRISIVALFFLSSLPAMPQQSADRTASETVVVPGWPGTSGNREIRIGGQEIVSSPVTGPEFSVTAQVVQWEEGRSITVTLPSGETRVVPVPNNIIFPPDLRPGGNVTFLVRQTEDGRFRVTGMTTGMTSAPPYFGSAPPPPPPAPVVPPAPPPPGVSVPPVAAGPGGAPTRGKTVVGAAYLTITGTVTAFVPGVSITISDETGKNKKLALAKGTALPADLVVGDPVTARVPLQRPFDGKTTDKVDKPKPKKTPPPSKFEGAQVPKS
jgi:hypothetical protein